MMVSKYQYTCMNVCVCVSQCVCMWVTGLGVYEHRYHTVSSLISVCVCVCVVGWFSSVNVDILLLRISLLHGFNSLNHFAVCNILHRLL